jgi:hypothetical protein
MTTEAYYWNGRRRLRTRREPVYDPKSRARAWLPDTTEATVYTDGTVWYTPTADYDCSDLLAVEGDVARRMCHDYEPEYGTLGGACGMTAHDCWLAAGREPYWEKWGD